MVQIQPSVVFILAAVAIAHAVASPLPMMGDEPTTGNKRRRRQSTGTMDPIS